MYVWHKALSTDVDANILYGITILDFIVQICVPAHDVRNIVK